jgi:hypothetical protein
LGIPGNVREQADDGLRLVDFDLTGGLFCVLMSRAVKHDPVEQALATTRQVLQQFALLCRRQYTTLPLVGGLVH